MLIETADVLNGFLEEGKWPGKKTKFSFDVCWARNHKNAMWVALSKSGAC